MPLTGCSRPTVRARGSPRRSGGSAPSSASRSASARGVSRVLVLGRRDGPCRGADPVEVDALGDDRGRHVGVGEVDAEQLAEVVAQLAPREEDEVVGLLGEVAQEPVAEDEVLRRSRPRRGRGG